MPRNRTRGATTRARQSRRKPSAAEAHMWEMLRNDKLGFKFRREHPIGPYRLDLFCREAMLAVEMDGEQHDPVRDKARDQALLELGILTYRIPNIRFFLIGTAEFEPDIQRIQKLCEERSRRKAFPS